MQTKQRGENAALEAPVEPCWINGSKALATATQVLASQLHRVAIFLGVSLTGAGRRIGLL